MAETSNENHVRLLIADLSEDPNTRLFTDEQLGQFLAMTGDNVNRAAAKALTTIAASELLLSKKVTDRDLTTDGPAVASELRRQAAELRKEADAEEAREGDEFSFAVIPDRPGSIEGAEEPL